MLDQSAPARSALLADQTAPTLPLPPTPPSPPAGPAPRASRREVAKEERLEVLRLLEEGGIDADEAAALLEALDRSDRAEQAGRGSEPTEDLVFPPPAGDRGRVVRIRITESHADKPMVNLAVPLGLVQTGLDIASQFRPEYMPSVEAIRESAVAGFRGHILDIDDNGDRVEIVIE